MHRKPPLIKQKAKEIINKTRWKSNEDVLDTLLTTFHEELKQEILKEKDFPVPKTISRWREEFQAEEEKIQARQLAQKNLKSHRSYLLQIVDMLLAGDIKHVIVVNNGESIEKDFGISSPEKGFYEINRSQLVVRIENNIDDVCEHENFDSFDMFDCFTPHLMAEYPPEQDYYELLNKYPGKLIYTLKLLAKKKTFKGTCPVCEEWQ